MTTKIFVNFGRRKVIYCSVILMSFLLIQWQFYSGNQIKFNNQIESIQATGTSNQLLLPASLEYVNTGDNSSNSSFSKSNESCVLIDTRDVLLNNVSSTSSPTVDVSTSAVPILLEPQPELYQMIERFSAEDKLLRMNTTFKRILFWNEGNNKNKNYGVGHGRDVLQKLGCPVWQCETSANRTDVGSYDAVLFHLRTWSSNDLPHPRLAHQRYVFWSMESAAWRIYSVAPMAEFFNWTMTYRWDSDVVAPYGYVRPIGNVPLHPSEAQMKFYLSNHRNSSRNYAKGKTKMAVWFASNCRTVVSSRNELVKELQKYIAIDVYGTCGNLTCPKKQDDSYESSEECRDLAASEHKFYLSLENSLCRDYVTEKLFAMMHRPIIPVVYGLHDDQEKLAPPHSFINAAKFENTKALADYLILLNNNDTLYNEYFWWKPYFQVHDSEDEKKKSMCRLCAALHDERLPPKIYHNLTDWWDTQSSCIFSPKIL